MQENVQKMTINYSPNFNSSKRRGSDIKYIIFHYTGMKSENGAIKRLIDENSKVSCHYLIKSNGKIIQMVPDLYVAWHAGISSWKKDFFLNFKSIGIEISNPGHQHGYENFKKKQIKSIIELSKILKKKYKIKNEDILGHSDIAPLRKKDPGEKFPWKLLHKEKLSLWHNISKKRSKKLRNLKLNKTKNFYKLLFKFGYKFSRNAKDKIKIYKSFQRRFRPELVSSIVDRECYAILKSLI